MAIINVRKIACCTLGSIFLVLTVVGLALPVVPQIPFLLLTIFFFSKGSPRFKEWVERRSWYQRFSAKHRSKFAGDGGIG